MKSSEHSLTKKSPDEATDSTTSDAYSELPTKAQTYLRKVEDRIGRAFDKAMELELAGENGNNNLV